MGAGGGKYAAGAKGGGGGVLVVVGVVTGIFGSPIGTCIYVGPPAAGAALRERRGWSSKS